MTCDCMVTPTTARPRLGIFGTGRMGRVHLEHLVRLHRAGRIDFVAMGDPLPATLDAARAYVSTLGEEALARDLAAASTPDRMATDTRLDAVVVASRTEDHARDIVAFARRGVPVLVEKPVASSIAEAAAIIGELGAAADRLVQVAFQRHYDAATRAAAAWVEQGLIGSIQQSDHVLQDKNPTPEAYQSCGITADMAIHLVFEAMSLRGFTLPRRVQALQYLAPPYDDRAGEGANIVHVFCQWADGSLAHLWGSRINGTGYDNSFTLTGTEGRIDVGAFAGDFGPIVAKLWRGTGAGPLPRGTLVESLTFPMTPPLPHHPDFYARFAAAYEAELSEFVSRVGTGVPLEPGLDAGWKTLLVANVAEASSRQAGRVFELTHPDGRAIESAADAAAFAAASGVA
jgi:myo-inositol 2-dehydrogenase / D-chiro-inositol 1-dehydrogenase